MKAIIAIESKILSVAFRLIRFSFPAVNVTFACGVLTVTLTEFVFSAPIVIFIFLCPFCFLRFVLFSILTQAYTPLPNLSIGKLKTGENSLDLEPRALPRSCVHAQARVMRPRTRGQAGRMIFRMLALPRTSAFMCACLRAGASTPAYSECSFQNRRAWTRPRSCARICVSACARHPALPICASARYTRTHR